MIVEVMIFGSFMRQLDDVLHKMLINHSITIGVGAGVMTSQKQDVDPFGRARERGLMHDR